MGGVFGRPKKCLLAASLFLLCPCDIGPVGRTMSLRFVRPLDKKPSVAASPSRKQSVCGNFHLLLSSLQLSPRSFGPEELSSWQRGSLGYHQTRCRFSSRSAP